MTKKIQSIPEARLLLESLRSVGYNEETAIADIIDNCISAKAHEIKIQFDWEKKRIVISDDGLGMSSKDLIENMRIGSSDPNQVRDERDLGRFGMGMKTAAFSLGKKLTVVTKSNSTVSNASWDLEQIPSIGWNLIIRDESEISEFSSQIDEQGTVVIIENLRDWEELRVTMSMFSFESSFELLKSLIQYAEIKDGAYLRFVPNTGYRYVTSEETLSAIAYKNSNLLIPDGKSMGTYRFCNENVRFTILDKNKYYNAEPAQYILSIGFRPEDTTSEQMLNCIRNLIDIGIIAKDDASS